MAIGNPVSYWYGTKAQYNAIQTKLEDTLYFITDEQTLYKGTVRFAEGVEQLSDVGSSAPANPSAYDKYFNTSDGKIYVYNGATWGNAYTPVEGALYYDKNHKRFVYYDGANVTMDDVYDAGVSGNANQGVSIEGTGTVTVANASVNGKGVVQVGDNIDVNASGVISVAQATSSKFGVVKTGDNVTNTNGVISVAKATNAVLGVVKVGTNIDVADGVISVKTASTSDPGIVQLVNNPASSDMGSEVKAITPHAVGVLVQDLQTSKQDNLTFSSPLSNTNETVTIANASTDGVGVIQIATSEEVTAGSDSSKAVVPSTLKTELDKKQDNLTADTTTGIEIVSGTTVKNDIATVEEVLTGATGANIVDADNLRGALSVGQAVDVSCRPHRISDNMATYGKVAIKNADGTWSDWVNFSTATWGELNYLNGFKIQFVAHTNGDYYLGWAGQGDAYGRDFPKYAPGLNYLVMMDVKSTGASLLGPAPVTGTALWSGSKYYSGTNNVTQRLATTSSMETVFIINFDKKKITEGATYEFEFSNWRQYEVTALTDEAIVYLAQLPDPDAFFRSASAYSIRNKYLIKQDMVCPFIPTINMPDNSDLTVAAGLSYKITYTDNNSHNVTVDTIPTNAYGWDSHIQMFVKGASNVKFKEPLILMDALTSNAGHNLIVKYRNGQALVYVDDLNAGNIVISTSGSTAGTLNYYLTQNPDTGHENYIVFGAVTDGAVCDASSVSVAYNTNVIGNGTDKTTITGTYNVASGKTVNMQDLSISGSTFGGTGITRLSNVSIDNTTVDVATQHAFKLINNIELKSSLYNKKGLFLDNVIISSADGSGTLNMSGNTTRYLFTLETPPKTRVLNNISITGIYTSAAWYTYGYITFNDCKIYGNTVTSDYAVFRFGVNAVCTLNNCSIYDNSSIGDAIFRLDTSTNKLILRDTSLANRITINKVGQVIDVYNTLTVSGTKGCIYDAAIEKGHNVHLNDSCVIDISDYTGTNSPLLGDISIGSYASQDEWVIGGYITIKTATTTIKLSGCSFTELTVTGQISSVLGDIQLANMSTWLAENAIFASPLDASAAFTVKLSGTTFTDASKIDREPIRIQLPASTTVSVRGNSAANATDKIITAPIIVVGDNASSGPNGSATIEYGTNNTSSISGLGTYIAKDGSNDFTTGITSVTTSDGLSAGLAGSNRWVKMSNDLTTSATYNADTTVTDKRIITNEYEPVLAGTYTISSGGTMTVDEATKTATIEGISIPVTFTSATIPNGASVSVPVTAGTVNARFLDGGGVLDLQNSIQKLEIHSNQNNRATFKDITIKNGRLRETTTAYGVIYGNVDHVDFINCTFEGFTKASTTTTAYGGVGFFQNTKATMTGCVFRNNVKGIQVYCDTGVMGGSTLEVTNCIFDGNNGTALSIGTNSVVTITGNTFGSAFWAGNYGGTYNFAGYNKLLGVFSNSGNMADSLIYVSAGAIVDLTGNTHTTVMNPLGSGITFAPGGATVVCDSSWMEGASSCTLSNTTVPALTNNCRVYLPDSSHRTIYGGHLDGVGITSGGAFTGIFTGECTLTNCRLAAMTVANVGAHLILTGTNYTSQEGTISGGWVTLSSNSILDVSAFQYTTIFSNIGTLLVEDNVNFKNGSTLIPITGGTYHNATIVKNGTITEA